MGLCLGFRFFHTGADIQGRIGRVFENLGIFNDLHVTGQDHSQQIGAVGKGQVIEPCDRLRQNDLLQTDTAFEGIAVCNVTAGDDHPLQGCGYILI